MRLRIHHPLFAGFVGVIALLVLLVVVLAGRGIRRELTETTRDALVRELATEGEALRRRRLALCSHPCE